MLRIVSSFKTPGGNVILNRESRSLLRYDDPLEFSHSYNDPVGSIPNAWVAIDEARFQSNLELKSDGEVRLRSPYVEITQEFHPELYNSNQRGSSAIRFKEHVEASLVITVHDCTRSVRFSLPTTFGAGVEPTFGLYYATKGFYQGYPPNADDIAAFVAAQPITPRVVLADDYDPNAGIDEGNADYISGGIGPPFYVHYRWGEP